MLTDYKNRFPEPPSDKVLIGIFLFAMALVGVLLNGCAGVAENAMPTLGEGLLQAAHGYGRACSVEVPAAVLDAAGALSKVDPAAGSRLAAVAAQLLDGCDTAATGLNAAIDIYKEVNGAL